MRFPQAMSLSLSRARQNAMTRVRLLGHVLSLTAGVFQPALFSFLNHTFFILPR
jgi:hypothetical protein